MAPTTLIQSHTHSNSTITHTSAGSAANICIHICRQICANCTFGRSCSNKNTSIKAVARSQMTGESLDYHQAGLKAVVLCLCAKFTRAHKRTSVWWKLLICGRRFFQWRTAHTHTLSQDDAGRTGAHTKRLSFSRRTESKFYAITSTNFKGGDLSFAC